LKSIRLTLPSVLRDKIDEERRKQNIPIQHIITNVVECYKAAPQLKKEDFQDKTLWIRLNDAHWHFLEQQSTEIGIPLTKYLLCLLWDALIPEERPYSA
jgi:hypothetical protein